MRITCGDPFTPSLAMLPASPAVATVRVRVDLQSVVDLTDLHTQRQVRTSVQELTGDWEGYRKRSAKTSVCVPTGLAPTQLLGQALFDAGDVEGCLYVSAKWPVFKNLVVFPEHLLPGSTLEFLDAKGHRHIRTG
jgi:hypothetical protein